MDEKLHVKSLANQETQPMEKGMGKKISARSSGLCSKKLPKKEKIGFTNILQKLSFIPRIHNRYFVFSVRNVAQMIFSQVFRLIYLYVK